MMNCPYCQTANPAEAKFCMNCGKPLNLICSQCGIENPPQAKFCINCGNPFQQSVLKEPDPVQRFIPIDYAQKLEAARQFQTMKGERRIVTILFCDVKGSTAMAEKLDPEEWAEIINQAFEYLITPIYKYEGTLARLMGDSILAFFGAPIAHEDDAQRAVLAGLDIIKGIQPFRKTIERRYNLDFNVRVGINTGLVVVGGVGSDLFMEYTALGDAINIASRMEQTARPGTIQIAEDTYKNVHHLFELEPVEGVEIKGKSDPILVYRVLRSVDAPAHLRGIQGLAAPLIGRSAELEKFRQILDEVKKGRGQIVSLVAEAGLGKSRLLSEVREAWESIDLGVGPFGKLSSRWNQAVGVSYESSRPYGLIQRLIRNFIGLSPSDSPELVRQTLAETLEEAGYTASTETRDIFEAVLGVKHTNGNQREGEEFKRAIYKEFLSAMDFLVQQGPTVIAIDDLHWSDQTSAEFITHLFQLANRLPILFICAFRPERNSPAWALKQTAESEYAHRYTEITLTPLSDFDSEELVDRLFTTGDLPPDVRKMILDKTDGNPFFMEEVIRTLVDNDIVAQDSGKGKLKVASNIDEITIPDSLQALIAARIDRLEETSKYVLQMASVIGRSFYRQVLEIITDAADELDIELNNLQRMGLILEAARKPYLEYIFRQALTQETAYNTILLKHRREFHKRVAEAWMRLFPNRDDEFASVLGHHFYQARDPRAVTYFRIEADKAFKLYANLEAISYFSQAIEAAKWASEPDLDQLVYLYTRRGRAYELNSQFSEALGNYKELENLAREHEAVAIELGALIAQAQIYSIPNNEFDVEAGENLISKAEMMAEELQDQTALAKIYWITANLYRFSQNLAKAQSFGEKAIAFARELGLEEQLAYSLTDTAHTYTMDGQMVRAREISMEGIQLWRRLDNQPMLADCLTGTAVIHILSGDFDLAYRYSDEAYEISRRIENVWGQAYSRYAIGIVDMERGEIDLAIHHFNQAIKDAQESNFLAGQILIHTFLSILYTDLGHHQLAMDMANSVCNAQPKNLFLANSFFKGVVLLSQVRAGNLEEAERLVREDEFAINQMNFFSKQYAQLALFYLDFAKGDYESAIRKISEYSQHMLAQGVEFLVPELLVLISKSQIALGLWDEAEVTLGECQNMVEKQDSLRIQWQADYLLAQCALHNGDQEKASAHFRNSRDAIVYILDHISDDELKNHFLNRTSVRSVLETQVVAL